VGRLSKTCPSERPLLHTRYGMLTHAECYCLDHGMPMLVKPMDNYESPVKAYLVRENRILQFPSVSQCVCLWSAPSNLPGSAPPSHRLLCRRVRRISLWTRLTLLLLLLDHRCGRLCHCCCSAACWGLGAGEQRLRCPQSGAAAVLYCGSRVLYLHSQRTAACAPGRRPRLFRCILHYRICFCCPCPGAYSSLLQHSCSHGGFDRRWRGCLGFRCRRRCRRRLLPLPGRLPAAASPQVLRQVLLAARQRYLGC
jgi:hypothetical protein